MKNAMLIGLAVGMVAGACLATNCSKARNIVSDAQEQVKSKLCPSGQCDTENGEQQNG